VKLSRRHFIETAAVPALAGLGIVASPFAAAQTAESNKPKFRLGAASYTFRNFDRAKTIAMSQRAGFERICFKDMHLKMTATNAECAAATEECTKAGLSLYACGVVSMRNAAEVDNAFRYAQAAGMETIVAVPQPAVLPQVEDKVKETGIYIAIHNHGPGDLLYPASTDIMEKVEKFDKRIGVCLDVGHTVRLGLDPVEAIFECGERLLDIHLKDQSAATAQSQTLVCGQGIIDFPAIIRALIKINYQGVIGFEYEAEGKDPLPGLAESVGFVRGVIRSVA